MEDTSAAGAEVAGAPAAWRAVLPGLAVPSDASAIEVGSADDPAEHDADRVAATVVSRLRRKYAHLTEGPVPMGHGHPGTRARRAVRSAVDRAGIGPEGGQLPSAMAAMLARSQGAGRALPGALRRQLEPAFGTDLGAVRIHTGQDAGTLNRGMQAQAFTVGSDIYFRDGMPDTGTDQGMTLLAHELAHTQQRDGHTPRRTLRRVLAFTPFSDLKPAAASVEGMRMDHLMFHGLSYPEGGTLGNSVNMEHMVSNTGGSSAPGEPAGIWRLRSVDSRLVWGNGQEQAATAMHAINGDFTEGANDEARNIFMGTAASNTDLHFHMVEKPIRAAFQSNPSGLALAYERALKQWPPLKHPSRADVLVWCDASVRMPGATQVGQSNTSYDHDELPGHVTHVVTVNPSVADAKERPRIVQYTVEPKYTYGAGDQLPDFLKGNIQRSRDAIEEALQPGSRYTEQQIKEQSDATDYLFTWGHLLFPETYTCTAVYWVASYMPDKPWLQQTESENYDAERLRSKKRGLEPDNASDTETPDTETTSDTEMTPDTETVSLTKPRKKAKKQTTADTGAPVTVANDDEEMDEPSVAVKPTSRHRPTKRKGGKTRR